MSRNSNWVWLLAAAAMWSGCSLGPLASCWAVPPAQASVEHARFGRALAPGAEGLTAPVAALALTDEEIGALRGEYAAGRFELAELFAGDEIVVRHVYGEPEPVSWDRMAPMGKAIVIVGMAFLVWFLIDVMSYDYTY